MFGADMWIEKLDLIPHPEGGYFREIYRSEEILHEGLPERFTGDRCFCTAIYYLLLSGQISTLHKIKSDETWHFYQGSPLELYMISLDGVHTKIVLGNNIAEGEVLQFTVPHGSWFGARPILENSYTLVGNTVAPGFDFDDFEMGNRDELIKSFPQLEQIIIELTKTDK